MVYRSFFRQSLQRCLLLSLFLSCALYSFLSIILFGTWKKSFSAGHFQNSQIRRQEKIRTQLPFGKSGSDIGFWLIWRTMIHRTMHPPGCNSGCICTRRLQSNYGSVQLHRCSKRPDARCFLVLPKRKGGWPTHPQLCIPFISF